MNKSNIIPEITYQEKPILDKFSCYLNWNLSNITSEILRPYWDKIIDIIRHWEPQMWENEEKLWLSKEWIKQIEEQAKKIKEFYWDEKITLFCDLETQRMQETFNILSDEKYWLNLENIQDSRLATSYSDWTSTEKDFIKGWELVNFWREQIKNKNHKNIIILWHSSFITFLEKLPENENKDLNLAFKEIWNWEWLHIRLDSENNKKDVLNWKLNINFSNFEEIKKDLLKINNSELNKIINSKLDKNNIWNLLKNFFDKNIGFIYKNISYVKNIDLKDFFIYKLYESWRWIEISMEKNVNEQYDITKAIDEIEDELLDKNRHFKDLWNLVKIIDNLEEIDKNEILIFIENNKLDNNCRLLFDETEKDLYKIWNNKKNTPKLKDILDNNIKIEIKKYIDVILSWQEVIPELNKYSRKNERGTYVASINNLLKQVKEFKKYVTELWKDKKEIINDLILRDLILSMGKENSDYSIKEEERWYFISVIRDYILDNDILDLNFENLSVEFFQYLVYANLEWINKINVDNISNKSKIEIVNSSIWFLTIEESMKFYLLAQKDVLDWNYENIWKWVIENEKVALNFLSGYLDGTGLYDFKGENKVKKFFKDQYYKIFFMKKRQ